MWTEFRYTVGRLRGQILGWGIAIAVLGLILVPFYSSFQEQQEQFLQLVENYPPELLAFFGGADVTTIATPEGYLQYYLFSLLPIIVCIFAVLAASGLIASDEESGRLDLILAHPVGRMGFFWGRVAAFGAAALAVVLLGWLGCVILLGTSGLNVGAGRLALPFLTVLAEVLIYGALALLMSLALPSRGLTATVAGLLMVGSYFLSSLGTLNEALGAAARFLPYEYYQGGEALHGLNWGWLGGLVGVSAIFTLLACWLFRRRDIRVGGEGGWRLPWRRLRRSGARQGA